uniref:Uncharacterized protein n=1 Tax=Anguilla anguilla TaxID=7936 RepID=A0A0E9V8H3_ANGAN
MAPSYSGQMLSVTLDAEYDAAM